MSGEAAHEDDAAPGEHGLVHRHQDGHEDEDYGENQDQDHDQPRMENTDGDPDRSILIMAGRNSLRTQTCPSRFT